MSYVKDVEEKVFCYLKKHFMLEAHDKVVIGVSGGADSVCLLFMLLEWSKQCPLAIQVVHIDHGIRREAGQDAEYVQKLCSSNGLPCHVEKADIRTRAAVEHISEEEAGRLTRYEVFRKEAQRFSANKIAVAHNSNDRAETMLFHLFRGSGLTGLCSIHPVREEIIRPLLCLERREIEQYLEEKGIAYRTDRTNLLDDYTRNRIRHHILPYAEKEIVAGAVSHMARTADILLETEEYLILETRKAAEKCVSRRTEGIYIEITEFLTLHMVLQKKLLLMLIKEVSHSGKNITAKHVESAMELFTGTGNRELSLPYGVCIRRQYQEVILEKTGMEPDRAGNADNSTMITLPQAGNVLCVVHGGFTWEFRIFACENYEEFPEKLYTKWFDCDKMEKSLVIRYRQEGDFLCIRTGSPVKVVRKKVKEFYIDKKIPQKERDMIPLLAEKDHVLWVVGHRISEYYKVGDKTKRILQVQLIDSKNGG